MRLRNNCKEKSFREVGEALYDFLVRTRVPEHLKDYAIALDASGLPDLAGEQDRIWDVFISIIDRLTAVYGDERVTNMKQYAEFSA